MTTIELSEPTAEVSRQAREASRQLAALPARRPVRLRIEADGADAIDLPAEVVPLLRQLLDAVGQGEAIQLVPVADELTTQEAADLLGVSRPYLIRLLEDGKIPFRLVGTHRRVRRGDLLAFKVQDDARRRQVADELSAEAQELGMGY